MRRATVRLVNHGEKHPYVIEVTTPGWRGVDHTFGGVVNKQSMPADLREIEAVLKKANIKYYSVSDPNKEGLMLFMADGTTEFVLRDATDFGAAVTALVRAGWLSPKIPPHLPV